MRKSVYKVPKVIRCYSDTEDDLILPRGILKKLMQLFDVNKIDYVVNDYRNRGQTFNFKFKGALRDEQEKLVNAITSESNGFIVAPTGFGKTVLAAYLIGKFQTNTLIILKNVEHLKQWKEKLEEFLDFGKIKTHDHSSYIGTIYSYKKSITNIIDLALVQTLASNDEYLGLTKNYGLCIVDEATHMAAVSYQKVISEITAKNLFGLTATPERSDYLEKINYLTFGDIIYNVDYDEHCFDIKKTLIPHFTKTRLPMFLEGANITDFYSYIISDEYRNEQIINDVLEEYKGKRNILVLSDRIEHIKYLDEYTGQKSQCAGSKRPPIRRIRATLPVDKSQYVNRRFSTLSLTKINNI